MLHFLSNQTEPKNPIPVRNKNRDDTVLEPDLGTLGSCHRRNISVTGQQQIAVDQEPGTGSGDSDHGGGFIRENGGSHSFGLTHAFAETPRLAKNAHFGMVAKSALRLEWWIWQARHCREK